MVQVQGGAKAARGRVPGECGALGWTYPPCPWFTPAPPKSLSRKLPASGVVAISDEAGRLACAIIASGGFLAAWLAACDRWRGQQML